MEERGLSDVELRSIVDRAVRVEAAHRSGRWLIVGTVGLRTRTVVVEPDLDEHLIDVVTAYPRD